MKLNWIVLAAALSLGLAPMAYAQSQTSPAQTPSAPAGAAPATPPGAASPVTSKLSEAQVIQALQAHGYTGVHTVQRNGDTLQMQAQKDGKPVKLVVNTATRRAFVQRQ
jgi:hypothetical protein